MVISQGLDIDEPEVFQMMIKPLIKNGYIKVIDMKMNNVHTVLVHKMVHSLVHKEGFQIDCSIHTETRK